MGGARKPPSRRTAVVGEHDVQPAAEPHQNPGLLGPPYTLTPLRPAENEVPLLGNTPAGGHFRLDRKTGGRGIGGKRAQ